MTITPITTLHEIPRDGWGRPMVIPPKGGKPVAYTRCTTYVGALEDTYNLEKWKMRMVALGLAARPDLMLKIAGTSRADDDAFKKSLNEICDTALEAAQANAAATIGTALHALTERMDRGEDVGVIPQAYKADLLAYAAATSSLYSVHIERFSVCDDLKIGGTPDRIVDANGRLKIADVKTGSIEYGMGKIAMQLAVYAHSQFYDHTTGERSSIGDVDLDTAIVIHLPAGTGTCELVEVDIAAGWEAVQLAGEVRKWRARRKLSRPYTVPMRTILPQSSGTDESPETSFTSVADTASSVPEPPAPDPAASAANGRESAPAPAGPGPSSLLEDAVAQAPTVERLTQLWNDNQAAWNDDLTLLAKARRVLIESGTAK